MGTAVKGKDKIIKVHDGTALVEVPFQGDATYNPGKTPQNSRSKNGGHAFHNEEGETITFAIEKERPALTVHTRLRTLAASGELVEIEYADKNTGGESKTGTALVTLGEESAGVDGVVTQQVTLTVDGVLADGVVA